MKSGSGPFLLEELREQKINDGSARNRNVLPFEVGQICALELGENKEPETAICTAKKCESHQQQ
jgi:hypothetical protein